MLIILICFSQRKQKKTEKGLTKEQRETLKVNMVNITQTNLTLTFSPDKWISVFFCIVQQFTKKSWIFNQTALNVKRLNIYLHVIKKIYYPYFDYFYYVSAHRSCSTWNMEASSSSHEDSNHEERAAENLSGEVSYLMFPQSNTDFQCSTSLHS